MKGDPEQTGVRIPWVAAWSGGVPSKEESAVQVSRNPQTGELWIFQGPNSPQEREANGILWAREGIARTGEPLDTDSIYRQRAAMRKKICRICGQVIKQPVIHWLLGPGQLEFDDNGDALTVTPPTCDDCADIASDLYPQLTEACMTVKVLSYELWGVWGDVAMETPGDTTSRRIARGERVKRVAPASGVDLTAVLAKREVVRFEKFRIVGEI